MAKSRKSSGPPPGYQKVEWWEYLGDPSLWGKKYKPIPGYSDPTNIQTTPGQPGGTTTPGAPPGTPGGPTLPGTTPVGLFGGPTGGGFWTGEKPSSLLYQPYYPYQQEARYKLLNQALGQMEPLDFEPIAEAARKGFHEETLPTILERFNQLGGERSSAFPQILGSASRGLESDLAAQRSQYGLAQNELLQKLLGIGLTPEIESIISPGRPGALQGLIGSLGSGLGQAAGSWLRGGF